MQQRESLKGNKVLDEIVLGIFQRPTALARSGDFSLGLSLIT